MRTAMVRRHSKYLTKRHKSRVSRTDWGAALKGHLLKAADVLKTIHDLKRRLGSRKASCPSEKIGKARTRYQRLRCQSAVRKRLY